MTLFYFYKCALNVISWANRSLLANDLLDKSMASEGKQLSSEKQEVPMKNKIETLGPFFNIARGQTQLLLFMLGSAFLP